MRTSENGKSKSNSAQHRSRPVRATSVVDDAGSDRDRGRERPDAGRRRKIDEKGENLSLEAEKLLKLLTRLVQDFEQRLYKPREATPLEVLRHLMEARGVKQSQLWEVFGSKGIASEVLNGKRSISKTHARALANYFHVSADLFV